MAIQRQGMHKEGAVGTIIQARQQSNDVRHPRWDRIERAERFDQYLDRLDTMLVRRFPQRAAVGKLLFHHARAITMEEQASDHPSDLPCVGEHDSGSLI